MTKKYFRWVVWLRAFGVFAGFVSFAPPVSADRALMPLLELIDVSDSVLIGQVRSIAPGQQPGEQIADLNVEQVYLGSALSQLSLRGSTIDPDLPKFTAGQRILGFLTQSSVAGVIYTPVAGEHGVITLTDGTVAISGEILTIALRLGRQIRLGAVQEVLKSQVSPPRVLLGALLEELTLYVTREEASLVAEIACNSQGTYARDSQLWAILSVGRLKVDAAHPCLETLTRERRDPNLTIFSVEALGNLGDSASVPVLRSILPDLPLDPTARYTAQDKKGDTRVTRLRGPSYDPENETAPIPDLGETTAPGSGGDEDGEPADGRFVPPSSVVDGETEPDASPRDDKERRRADAGLSDAAIMALGKIGDPAAVPDLFRLASSGDDLALHSSVVRALGLIGGMTVRGPLSVLKQKHPNALVRELAKQTLERLQ